MRRGSESPLCEALRFFWLCGAGSGELTGDGWETSHWASSSVQPGITEIQNLLSNSKVRNVIHSGRITFRVLTNYIPRLGELQSAVMANYIPRSRARPTP